MGWDKPATHRQVLAWDAWLNLQWDRPSRSDWYAMQIAAEVRYVFSQASRPVDKFRLRFSAGSETSPREVSDTDYSRSEARKWAVALGADMPEALRNGNGRTAHGN